MIAAALQARCHRCGREGRPVRGPSGWEVECSGCGLRPDFGVASAEEAWRDWNGYQASVPPHAAPSFEPWWVGEAAPTRVLVLAADP